MKKKLLVLLLCMILPAVSVWTGAAGLTPDEPDPAVDEKVRAIVAETIKPGMTEKQKAKALHDWLIYHAYYAWDVYTGQATWEEECAAHSVAGVLLNGKGVCESYAKAYDLLLKEAGIADEIITGGVITGNFVNISYENHAWNLVRIDGVWYQVDVTFDDPGKVQKPKSGSERWNYFMADNDSMNKKRMPDEESTKKFIELMGPQSVNYLPEGMGIPKGKGFPKFGVILSDGTSTTINDLGSGKPMMILVCGSDDLPYELTSMRKENKNKIRRYGLSVLVVLDESLPLETMQQLQAEYPEYIITKYCSFIDSFNLPERLFNVYGNNSSSTMYPVFAFKDKENQIAYLTQGWGLDPTPMSRLIDGAILMTDGPVEEEEPQQEEPEPEPEPEEEEEEGEPWPEDVFRHPGDVNSDGVIDGRDVIVLMRVLAGDDVMEYIGHYYKNNADVNNNQIVNIKDLLLLVRYLAGEDVVLE